MPETVRRWRSDRARPPLRIAGIAQSFWISSSADRAGSVEITITNQQGKKERNGGERLRLLSLTLTDTMHAFLF